MRKILGLLAILICGSSHALTVIDFTKTTSAQITAATVGNTITLNGYTFTGDNFVPTVACSTRYGCYRGIGAPAVGHTLTVARADGKAFTLSEVDTFVAGTLVTGPTDIELKPFNASHVLGKQVNFIGVANQFSTKVAIDSTAYPTFTNITGFQVLSGAEMLVDHYTGFAFTELSTTSAAAEPATIALLMLGILGIIAIQIGNGYSATKE